MAIWQFFHFMVLMVEYLRSLSYLCRSFDNLEHDQNYVDVKAAVQIGLLDFTLFPEHPEFYATYQMLNATNHM